MKQLTEKWYYTSPMTSEWTTTVTSSEKDGDTYIVTLAETAFYPKGGGQPCDNGTIAGIPVLEVFEKNAVIIKRKRRRKRTAGAGRFSFRRRDAEVSSFIARGHQKGERS
jgi:Ser-tRNA(Ala) deacylase AlaX